MGAEVSIRLADERDLDAVTAFGAAVVPPHYEPIIGRDAALEQVDVWWTRERLPAARETGALLVAEDDELVGVAELGTFEGDPVIWRLYVDPERRGQGIGHRLLQAAIAGIPRPASRVVLEHSPATIGPLRSTNAKASTIFALNRPQAQRRAMIS